MYKSQIVYALIVVHLAKIVRADIIIYGVDKHIAYNVLKDMPATFGETVPDLGLEGMMAIANPADGCDPLDPPPPIHNPALNWIALIARHNCTYERKVRMAQASGYDAVVVHNVDSDNLIAMTAANTTGIIIPSVFIGAYDANYLKELNSTTRFYLVITPDAPFNINTHLLLPFAIVVGVLFIVMIIFMIVKCIKDRRRARRHRLPTSALNKMLLHKFVKGDPYETCAICLDDYIEGEKLRVLPCAHAYHSKCIDPWLTNNRRVCPICKRKVFAQNEDPGAASDTDTDDDTTPLINNSSHHQQQQFRGTTTTSGGGTFSDRDQTVPPEVARREFERLFGMLREHYLNNPRANHGNVPVSTSINGESESSSRTSDASEPPGNDVYVHVHRRPESSSSSEEDEEVTSGGDNDVVV